MLARVNQVSETSSAKNSRNPQSKLLVHPLKAPKSST